MAVEPAILNVHTPTASFAIVHSLTQESLDSLFDKLTRKVHNTYHGRRVGQGWLKYNYNGSVWNLDDDSDYTIFTWRQQQPQPSSSSDSEKPKGLTASTSSVTSSSHTSPTIHLRDPDEPLPGSNDYRNASFYLFSAPGISAGVSRLGSRSPRPRSMKSQKTKGSKLGTDGSDPSSVAAARVPQHKKDFERFHSENGVRTVLGSIGPVQNVRMLLKAGYRHVYISRKFAMKHGFIPADAAPGHYGYGGLVNIGTWPITLNPTSSSDTSPSGAEIGESGDTAASRLAARARRASISSASGSLIASGSQTTHGTTKRKSKRGANGAVGVPEGRKVTNIVVYLSEEPHFDVVLGRSFFERRQIKTSSIDPTDVVCLDTGEKIECELVILKDGKGEIVTVT